MFSSFSRKKTFFFLRNKEILCFLCVLEPGDHFTESRPVSGGQNITLGKFQFQIISKPFDLLIHFKFVGQIDYEIWEQAFLDLFGPKKSNFKYIIKIYLSCFTIIPNFTIPWLPHLISENRTCAPVQELNHKANSLPLNYHSWQVGNEPLRLPQFKHWIMK